MNRCRWSRSKENKREIDRRWLRQQTKYGGEEEGKENSDVKTNNQKDVTIAFNSSMLPEYSQVSEQKP